MPGALKRVKIKHVELKVPHALENVPMLTSVEKHQGTRQRRRAGANSLDGTFGERCEDVRHFAVALMVISRSPWAWGMGQGAYSRPTVCRGVSIGGIDAQCPLGAAREMTRQHGVPHPRFLSVSVSFCRAPHTDPVVSRSLHTSGSFRVRQGWSRTAARACCGSANTRRDIECYPMPRTSPPTIQSSQTATATFQASAT